MTPVYDVERWGIKFVKSPRHADVVLVTGCGTDKAFKRSQRVLDQIPDDKVIVAVGTCACSGGIFKQGHKPPMKADIYVAGCPPKPDAMIKGIMEGVEKCSSKD
jgi:Ni,Fe-hydrogenase III small subunit